MPCDDEKAILDEEQGNYDEAKENFDGAKDSLDWNQWQFDTANLNMANCWSDCGDELSRFENATNDLGAAQGAFFGAGAALEEAAGWLDIAKELYCDCKNSEGGEVPPSD